MRIASLIPSGTDLACALGLQNQLVAISHECDHPAVKGLPVVTRSVIDSSLPPSQIDQAVNEAVSSGQSLYQTNRELLRELAPDVVLTQTICDVCAVNAQTAARDLPPGAKLIHLSATNFNELWDDIWTVAKATGTHQAAGELVDALEGRLIAVENAVKDCSKPRVLVIEWSDPPFLGGHWVPEMIQIAGGQHLLSGPNEPSRRATWDEIRAAAPDVIIVAPCGYDLEQTFEQAQTLPDIGAREVWATNATALFSRCTPATVRGVEVVAGMLHPDICAPPGENEARRL